jgi:MoaA/NifB/PqqE/SkfB family radical SAM enzyme
MKLSILYRGPLSSCNYACDYCPFAKRKESRAQLELDRHALERFVSWAAASPHQLSVLFTPWGEALVRPWYRDAIVQLSHFPNIDRVAAQTNLSCRVDWLAEANVEKVALWTTFHPTQVSLAHFDRRCEKLRVLGVRHSVGVVGLREHFEAIRSLRETLPPETYLWINAFKRQRDYYTPADETWLSGIDPLFPFNATAHPSRDRACRTGQNVFSIDGDGVMRRCHFVATPIGNIYEDDWERALMPRACPNEMCGCHIGYVHMESLGLDGVFGDGILERIPTVSSRVGAASPDGPRKTADKQ